jgi:hypothetical protein
MYQALAHKVAERLSREVSAARQGKKSAEQGAGRERETVRHRLPKSRFFSIATIHLDLDAKMATIIDKP